MREWNVDGKIRFPVDPFKIAENLGIVVYEEDLDNNLAGFIIRESADAPVEVYLNSNDSALRRRFTLAHELGHYIQRGDDEALGFVDKRSELAMSGADPQERWANAFAAELLMPAAIVKKYWAEGESADALAQKFQVSNAAINVRLSSLGLLR